MRIRVRFVRGSHAHVHVALRNHGALCPLPFTEGIVDLATDLVVGDFLRGFARRRWLVGAIARIFLVTRRLVFAWRFILAWLLGVFGLLRVCRLLGLFGLLGLFRLILITRIARLQRRDRTLDLVQPSGRALRQADLLIATDQPVDGARCGLDGRAVLLLDVPLHRQLIQPRLREGPTEVSVPADLVVVVLQTALGGQHALRGRRTGVVEENLHVAGAGELLHMEMEIWLGEILWHLDLVCRVKSTQARPDRAPLVSEVRVLRGMPQHRAGLA